MSVGVGVDIHGSTLEAGRFRLRLLEADDASDRVLYRSLYSCPRVMAHIAPPVAPNEADTAFERVCRHNLRSVPGHRCWRVERADSARECGIAALLCTGTSAEFGLMLHPSAWNGRVSRPVLTAVLGYAFEVMGLTRIDAECRDGPNTRILHALLAPLDFQIVPASTPGRARWSLSRSRWKRDTSSSRLA